MFDELRKALEAKLRATADSCEQTTRSGNCFYGNSGHVALFREAAEALASTPASSPPLISEVTEETDDVDPCQGGEHCCCCGPGEPCCDCGLIMPSRACVGEKCWCGAPAAKKVGEEVLFDDQEPHRHNLTSYVCAEHYAQLMGPLGAKQVGLTAALNPSTGDQP